MSQVESARAAYNHYAAIYDECNAQNDYEMWLGEVLLPELERHGLQKGSALDLGCGTGRAFDPLLRRGWQVVGCDISEGMLSKAARKFGSEVALLNVDVRNLPTIPASPGARTNEAFDLVLLLNDVLNYLTQDGDLVRVFAGIKRSLRRDSGLAIFDANTLALFQGSFTSNAAAEMRSRGLEWRGLTPEAKPGIVHEARLSARGVEPHIHRQRHWMDGQVREALEASDLRCLAALGQREDRGKILLSPTVDEERDQKRIYIAGHAT
jgi:SAM-dependent methyltransferase